MKDIIDGKRVEVFEVVHLPDHDNLPALAASPAFWSSLANALHTAAELHPEMVRYEELRDVVVHIMGLVKI